MPIFLNKESDVDVLIIGAGPAGLMCANSLARAGVNVRIIDERPAKVMAGQADGVQPRTIEVLQSYGLADRLLREGNQMHMVAFYNPSPSGGIERTGRAIDVTAPTARYPFEVTLHQGAIESIFLDSMRSLGVTVQRPVVPTSIELSQDEAVLNDPNSRAVKVVLKHLDPTDRQSETEVVHAKFVLGGDGAHSWVRKTFGITMDGEQTDYIWGVVDTVPETDFPDIRNRCAIHSNNGSCMVIPREGDKVRLYIQLSDKQFVDPSTGRVDKDNVSPEKLLEVAKKSFAPYSISTPNPIDWWTLYIIGQRVASKFSVRDRVFIAGDACHTHSPKAGQGMNASMLDTHNLATLPPAWKITYILRGWADMSLLKTYEFERRKYAQDLINFDKKFSTLFSGKPRTEDNQNGVSHEEFLNAFQTFGAFSSGIGVHYLPSAVVNPQHQSCATNLIVGQRMLPHIFIRAADARPYEIQDLLPADTRFKVLVFAGDTPDKAQLERVNALAAEMGKPESFLTRFGHGEPAKVFDILAISSAKKDIVNYTDLPQLLRPHWSKVLLDDVDMFARTGGGGYEAYGIDPHKGALVIVRPDGYVALWLHLSSCRTSTIILRRSWWRHRVVQFYCSVPGLLDDCVYTGNRMYYRL
ncbi:Phenol 2-monooxygenase [Grifola frondosa]|uniref:Phenol 2-monooxygenase n=1 Tax=Grifola frondosa TaxID=5627 RepID=A0A1C7MEV6_GRIFR|nr:Phenol 2-monooxygenase [Grifola frondosa]